jgi:hypothetical protein
MREPGRSRKTTTVSEEGKHGKFKRARERAVISYYLHCYPTTYPRLVRWLHLFFGVKKPLKASKVHILP